MEKKYPADRFRGKKILAVKYLAKKKKTYTEQTIFHGEKCWKKILGCVQTDATTPNIVAPSNNVMSVCTGRYTFESMEKNSYLS